MSEYLKRRYGAKVHRLVIDAGFTCPNREKGSGCIFCDPTGSGFNALHGLSVREQVLRQKEWAMRKYGATKFIAYFQSFTNTYAPINILREKYSEALVDDSIVQLAVSTRPDCVSEEVLNLLSEFKSKVDVSLELGLQTINSRTLRILNRGHGVAEFVDAVLRTKKHGFEIVVHVIVDLPWDELEDVVDTAKVLSYLNVDGVKIHSLYIVEDSPLGKMFKEGSFQPISFEAFIERTVAFLENLSPNIVIHRLVSDPPRTGTLFARWNLTKNEVVSAIESELKRRNTFQGAKFKPATGGPIKF
ncbi:tRNA modification radical SAM protein MnmL/YtqA [Pseudothermotoga sp.]|nr:TIGR01212 family radical SAM protein [Pseudothermotoga sp.]MCX7812931.1 TIGR01212 family radical SAM protein [Pseudothermotoga sp.]MDW8139830.1 TIGR01212 family radical SAM protein [Pseudothermotoga sp.]